MNIHIYTSTHIYTHWIIITAKGDKKKKNKKTKKSKKFNGETIKLSRYTICIHAESL